MNCMIDATTECIGIEICTKDCKLKQDLKQKESMIGVVGCQPNKQEPGHPSF